MPDQEKSKEEEIPRSVAERILKLTPEEIRELETPSISSAKKVHYPKGVRVR